MFKIRNIYNVLHCGLSKICWIFVFDICIRISNGWRVIGEVLFFFNHCVIESLSYVWVSLTMTGCLKISPLIVHVSSSLISSIFFVKASIYFCFVFCEFSVFHRCNNLAFYCRCYSKMCSDTAVPTYYTEYCVLASYWVPSNYTES